MTSAITSQGQTQSVPVCTPIAMMSSDQLDQIIPALAAAKQEISVIGKNKVNTYYNSRYADMAALEEVIGPSLAQHGLFLMQPTEIVMDTNGECHLRITTALWHSSGQFLSSASEVPYWVHNRPDNHMTEISANFFTML